MSTAIASEELDDWISQLSKCKHLEEVKLKLLCERVSIIKC